MNARLRVGLLAEAEPGGEPHARRSGLTRTRSSDSFPFMPARSLSTRPRPGPTPAPLPPRSPGCPHGPATHSRAGSWLKQRPHHLVGTKAQQRPRWCHGPCSSQPLGPHSTPLSLRPVSPDDQGEFHRGASGGSLGVAASYTGSEHSLGRPQPQQHAPEEPDPMASTAGPSSVAAQCPGTRPPSLRFSTEPPWVPEGAAPPVRAGNCGDAPQLRGTRE